MLGRFKISAQTRSGLEAAAPAVLMAGSAVAALLFFTGPRVFAKAGQAEGPGHWLLAQQGALILGFLYARLLARALTLAQGAALHCLVLTLAAATLPLAAAPAPALWLASDLLAPCFAAASNYVLMQIWARRGKAGFAPLTLIPALAGLIATPMLLDAGLDADELAHLWAALYAGLIVLFGVASILLRLVAAEAQAQGPHRLLSFAALAMAPCALMIVVMRDAGF